MIEPIRRLSVGRFALTLLPRQPYEARYCAAAPALGFAFETQDGEHAFDSDRLRPYRTRANSFAYVPKGCSLVSRSRLGGEYLTLTLPDALPAPQTTDRLAPDLRPAAHRLRAALLAPERVEALEVEALAQEFCDQAARALGLPPPKAAGWMTPQRLAKLDAAIDAGLAEGVTVAGLAATLGLSEGFFSRAVKAALGVSPQAYLLDHKLARARRLMTAGEADLSQVALEAGFASHAHLSTAFKRYLGITPTVFRAQIRG